jgi:hypothetical protein
LLIDKKIIRNLDWHFHRVKCIESNWHLEMLVLAEGEKPEKDARGNIENQQQTQLPYDAMPGN